MPATWPTSTPRILTLAPGSMTNPLRSDTSVTGTNERNVPAKNPEHTTTIAVTVANNAAVHHSGWMRRLLRLAAIGLTRQVEVAGLTVDGQREEQDKKHRRDQRGTHGPA